MSDPVLYREAKLRQLEADNARLKTAANKFYNLQKAVRDLYTAGFWTCDRIDDAEAKEIFVRLRDAAEITPGESPVPLVRGAA